MSVTELGCWPIWDVGDRFFPNFSVFIFLIFCWIPTSFKILESNKKLCDINHLEYLFWYRRTFFWWRHFRSRWHHMIWFISIWILLSVKLDFRLLERPGSFPLSHVFNFGFEKNRPKQTRIGHPTSVLY